jgi:hypothetical protein
MIRLDVAEAIGRMASILEATEGSAGRRRIGLDGWTAQNRAALNVHAHRGVAVRYALHQEDELEPFPRQVEERYERWLVQQMGLGHKFTDEHRATSARPPSPCCSASSSPWTSHRLFTTTPAFLKYLGRP